MLASTHLILPSTSSSSHTPYAPQQPPTSPSFLARLLLRRKPSSSIMSSPSSSSSSATTTSAQPQQVRVVHRPAAPSLGPLSRPHSEWRSERGPRDEFRGRSGRRRELRFDMPTSIAPIPIPHFRRSLSSRSSTSLSASRSIPTDSRSPSPSSSSFLPSSPPAYEHDAPISSLHSIQVRVAAARSDSSRSTGSYDSSAYFDDRSEVDEEEFDSSASSSAFSFIDGEEMEGVEEQGGEVAVRRASDGDVVMMDGDSSTSLNDIHHLHFARKPTHSLLNSPASPHAFASLPPITFGLGGTDGAELSFLARQAQVKGAQRRVTATHGWAITGGVSL